MKLNYAFVLWVSLSLSSAAAEVPNLGLEDKRYDPATGTVEFTLVNYRTVPAVAWSLQVLHAESDGGKATFHFMEDREPLSDPGSGASETPPEQSFVPAGGRLRQRLKFSPDVDGLAVITIKIQAVVYEDVLFAGDAKALDRVFASRTARLLEIREALDELFTAKVEGTGVEPVLARMLDRQAAADSLSGDTLEAAVEASRRSYREVLYKRLYEASIAEDPELWLRDLEASWADRVRRLARGLRSTDRERWGVGIEGEVRDGVNSVPRSVWAPNVR